MIAKRVPAPKKKSSFKQLSKYIIDPNKQHAIQKDPENIQALGEYINKPEAIVNISNCCFDSVPEAIKEIQATQKMNTRSKNDKTYHLVISFREGEQPGEDILKEVEKRITEKIGFADHQRISALHTDTNNWHIHVAINKVHPGTYRNVEPFYDKFKMSEACRELEKEFNLLPDNGIEKNRKKPMNPAQDMEAHTGIKSLVSWIKDNAAKDIKSLLESDNSSWSDLHKTFNKYGLTIRPRGAGFVIQDINSGLTVKASSVDRTFSKKQIENILGAYKEPGVMHTSKFQYTEGPTQPVSKQRDKLWEKYQSEKQKHSSVRKKHLQSINEQRKEYLRGIFKGIRSRKQEARTSFILRYVQKKRIYAALQVEKLQALESAKLIYSNNLESINNRYPNFTWTSFLQKEAENGNEIAVKMLRQNKGDSLHSDANHIGRSGKRQQPIYSDLKYSVDKRGRIKYFLQNSWVLDNGKQIQPGSEEKDILLAALQIAIGKYGNKLNVKGDKDFIAKVQKAAKNSRLNVTINGNRILSKGKQKGR